VAAFFQIAAPDRMLPDGQRTFHSVASHFAKSTYAEILDAIDKAPEETARRFTDHRH
jgi:hypothetical protein